MNNEGFCVNGYNGGMVIANMLYYVLFLYKENTLALSNVNFILVDSSRCYD